MTVIWERGESTLAQVFAELSPKRDLARNTVQTQLARLVEKGWLAARTEGKSFVYFPLIQQEAAQTDVLQRLVDTVFMGSTEGLMMSLLDGRKLTKQEADRIRAMIETAEEANNE